MKKPRSGKSTRKRLINCPAKFFMKKLFFCLLMLSGNALLGADLPEDLKLWPGDPPNMVPGAGPGVPINDETRMTKVGIPGMWIHQPEGEKKGRMAMIVCPGGAYARLANYKVGNGTVPAFLPKDVVVIVLKYRTVPPSRPVPGPKPEGEVKGRPKPPLRNVEMDALDDAKRAVRLVRHHAEEWGIDPAKIGMIGWSAGANLTLNLASHYDLGDPAAADPVDRQSCRPDFVALLCPWPSKSTIENYPIAAKAPPAFVASARDDQSAPTTFAEAIAAQYKAAGVPVQLWQIEQGGHRAFSYGSVGEGMQWPKHLWDWMVEMKIAAGDKGAATP
jgi:endo-1,4-beta-xylanase